MKRVLTHPSLARRRKLARRRVRQRRLLADGRLNPEQVSLAAALGPAAYQAPLDVSHVKAPPGS